jgi:hypothetical protein
MRQPREVPQLLQAAKKTDRLSHAPASLQLGERHDLNHCSDYIRSCVGKELVELRSTRQPRAAVATWVENNREYLIFFSGTHKCISTLTSANCD